VRPRPRELLGGQLLLGQEKESGTREAEFSDSPIHIAAHGNAGTGEIALAPLGSTTEISQEEDYLLKMSNI